MKYYLIFESTKKGMRKLHPTYIVDREDIAKSFCEEFTDFYYEERESGQYVFASTATPMLHNQIDENPFSKGFHDGIRCPYCDAQYYMEAGGMQTSMYCPTIVKEGKVISKDRNIYTTTYQCLNCGRYFKSVNGKIEKESYSK